MVKIVTKGTAEVARVKYTGSILRGKKASFTLLDRNSLTEEVKSTCVKNMYGLDGKMVYDFDKDEDRDGFENYA